jgi:hypothetical protein
VSAAAGAPHPLVDEHATTVGAPPGEVWAALVGTLDRSFSSPQAGWYVRAVGGHDRGPSGPRPLAEGSAIVGFHVVAADPGRELVLEGGHRFSSYTLTFRLDPVGAGRTRLRAETRASFPGVLGGTYRLLVIGTRGHAVVMRRLLAAISDRAEAPGAAAA